MSRAQKEGRLKLEEAEDALAAAEEELRLVEKDKRDGVVRVEEGEAEVRAIEATFEKEKQKADAEIADMIGEYCRLKQVILEEDKALREAIGAC